MKFNPKVVAEILVEYKYAEKYFVRGKFVKLEYAVGGEIVDPFADTLNGKRQAEVLENWLVHERTATWIESVRNVPETKNSKHLDRLDRIQYCINQEGIIFGMG